MRIIIAEDDSMPRKVLARRLKSWGYEVLQAENGAAAWEAYQEQPVEIVVSDWMMPEMDGVELCRRIRSAEALPHHDAIPYTYVVLLTSRADKESLVEGLSAGADDFIAKPFDDAELQCRIRAGERMVRLSGNLAQEANRADRHVQQVNTNITRSVQELLSSLDHWKRSVAPMRSDDAPAATSQDEQTTGLIQVVYDWATSLDSAVKS
ncbi:MAG: response regulator [Planctomycetales bacterium]